MRELNDNFYLEKSQYFDIKEDEDEGEEYFPVKSMEIENEWISNMDHKLARNTQLMEKSGTTSPYFSNAIRNYSSENVRFISPIPPNLETKATNSTDPTPKLNRSILNELLPTQVQLESSNYDTEEKEIFTNDKFYGRVFIGSLAIWSLWSLYLISSKAASSPTTEKLPEIVGWFVCLLILGLGMTAIWGKILAEQTEIIVYGLMLTIPVGFGLLGVTAFSHWYIFTGIIFFSLSAILIGILYLNRRNLKNTVEIVHSAAIFIQSTPKVYGLILKSVSLYVFFVIVWLMSFIRLFNSNNNLIFNFTSQILSIFMLVWVGSVISTIEKFIIATWVRSWMNQTDDNEVKNIKYKEKEFTDEEIFGSICLAAGLITLSKMIRILGKGFNFSGKLVEKFLPFGGIISSIFNWIFTLISYVEHLMQRFTDFAIYYLAIDGKTKGFINSCKEMSKEVHGHIGLAATADTTAQLLLTFSTALISFASTTLILFIAKSRVTWSSGALIGLLAVSVTGIISNVYTSAIDSTFLCYVIDLKLPERAGKIKNEIQTAFSSKISSV